MALLKKIIYVNGVNTSRQKAFEQANKLAIGFRHEVKTYWNPSATMLTALLESFVLRWSYKFYSPPIVKGLAQLIKTKIDEGGIIHVVAHSEGTAIAMNAVALLPLRYRWNVRLHLFANVASHEPLGCFAEYFRNDDDYVVTNLPGAAFLRFCRRFKAKKRGPVYVRRGGGHAFIESYLNNLDEFTGIKESEFYKLLEK